MAIDRAELKITATAELSSAEKSVAILEKLRQEADALGSAKGADALRRKINALEADLKKTGQAVKSVNFDNIKTDSAVAKVQTLINKYKELQIAVKSLKDQISSGVGLGENLSKSIAKGLGRFVLPKEIKNDLIANTVDIGRSLVAQGATVHKAGITLRALLKEHKDQLQREPSRTRSTIESELKDRYTYMLTMRKANESAYNGLRELGLRVSRDIARGQLAD